MPYGLRFALATALFAMLPASALANPNDISIRGLGRPSSTALDDPATLRFRALSNELAIAMSARPLAPAETLGMNGFEFALVSSQTPISYTEDYWQGQAGNPVFEGAHEHGEVPTQFFTPSLHLRKGLPMSAEIGITGTYLAKSEMFMLSGEGKLALHESFFRYAPVLSMRVAFGRLFGSDELDIVTGELDILTSLAIGVGGMAQITPYGGYGQVGVHINSQVIDQTPYTVQPIDQRGGADGSLYNFPTIEWKDNLHHRGFGGVRFSTAFLELIFEYDAVWSDNLKNSLKTYSIKFGFDA